MGASSNSMGELGSSRRDADDRSHLAATVELLDLALGEGDFAVDVGVNRPVLAAVRVRTRAVPVTLLADENLASADNLACEAFYTSALRGTVSAVGGRSTCFLMCHSAGILQEETISTR
jgi:hypothetical protein